MDLILLGYGAAERIDSRPDKKNYYYTVLQIRMEGSEYVDRKRPIFSLDARVQALLQNYCLHLKIFAFLDFFKAHF